MITISIYCSIVQSIALDIAFIYIQIFYFVSTFLLVNFAKASGTWRSFLVISGSLFAWPLSMSFHRRVSYLPFAIVHFPELLCRIAACPTWPRSLVENPPRLPSPTSICWITSHRTYSRSAQPYSTSRQKDCSSNKRPLRNGLSKPQNQRCSEEKA